MSRRGSGSNDDTGPVPASSDLELQANAYVDGELSDTERVAFESILAGNADLRSMVDDYQRMNQGLARLNADLFSAPPPAAHLELLVDRPRAPRRAWVTALAAGVAGMLLGGGVGWYAADTSTTTSATVSIDPTPVLARPLAQEAALAHALYTREKRHAVEVQANESRHLNAWLSTRLAQPVEAPDLRSLGFDLVGGRLLPDAGKPAAQFMFEDTRQQRLTLFIRSFGHDGGVRFAAVPEFIAGGGLGVWLWPHNGLHYALTGPLPKADLKVVVDLIRTATQR